MSKARWFLRPGGREILSSGSTRRVSGVSFNRVYDPDEIEHGDEILPLRKESRNGSYEGMGIRGSGKNPDLGSSV